MNKLIKLLAFISFWLLGVACHDDDSNTNPNQIHVNTTGGVLKSDDNKINVTIPPGAVGQDVSIEVNVLPSNLPDGIGKIYSLTSQVFLKPVTLTLTYSEEEITTKGISPAQLLMVTRKTTTDAWTVVNGFTIDTVNKLLKADVDHFSDWTIISGDNTPKINVTAAGTSLKSDDNNLTVTIPAGAVDQNVFIDITELTSNVSNGVGKIYSLTNQTFLKPVTLTVAYSEQELATKGTFPELLRLMTRKTAADPWTVVNDFTIDKETKTLKADVDHFSDWTIVSTNGTLQFTIDGLTHKHLDLSVTIANKTQLDIYTRPALFYAHNNNYFLRARADSTVMGTAYATRSAYLGKISGLTNSIADTTNILFIEPMITTGCYTHNDGSTRLRFINYSTTKGELVTGTLTLVGAAPTNNATCQTQNKKTITASFAYIVK